MKLVAWVCVMVFGASAFAGSPAPAEIDRRFRAEIAAELDKRMTRAPGKSDTHPSSSQRLAWAEQLGLPGDRLTSGDEAPVWDLFTDPETIEREMTAIIRARVKAKLYVEISDAEWEEEPVGEPPAG